MNDIDPDDVFAKVEADRKSCELAKNVTTAKITYQGSDREGYIEQINELTSERRSGTFEHSAFTPISDSVEESDND